MRSEDVHKAMTHGASKFELCRLVMRGVRHTCKLGGATPGQCIGIVLHTLAEDPVHTLEYQGAFHRIGAPREIAHAAS